MAEVDPSNFSSQELRRKFVAFLNSDVNAGEYQRRMTDMTNTMSQRLLININDVRELDPALAERIMSAPLEVLPELEVALKEAIADFDPGFIAKLGEHRKTQILSTFEKQVRFFVGFEGSFGRIVTKCSLVRPKVMRSVHWSPESGQFIDRVYRDATDYTGTPTGSVYPTKDAEGRPLETEFGLCMYKDHQTITIQEMPEKAPLGQLPRSVDVVLDFDLVDSVKPGDRVQIVGVYRALSGATAKQTTGLFRTVLLANAAHKLGKEIGTMTMTKEDIKHIRQVSRRKDVLELMSQSLAPSIYGHEYIKRAMLMLLLGGVEKNLENGTHIRGDINILMVGDPSTAKSQLLRFVLRMAPLAVNTTGRGSSGVGLTAAVTSDPETGDRRLEAGAMVLADRGVVCIDEFDKMSDLDRVAIHEVMEQQTVTIAKAGIQASLNARCSVVAAANPIYGQYDRNISPQKNVNLPDSLLSRFDLLFIVLDNLDTQKDRNIADHVLRMHQYERAGQDGRPLPLDFTPDDEDDSRMDETGTAAIYEKFNPLLHGGAAAGAGRGRGKSRHKVELLTAEFIKKYVNYAKNRVKPVLTDDARVVIAEKYNEIRQEAAQRTMPVTARTLETIIRVASAHAKLRLSKHVQPDDVAEAFKILQFALYHSADEVAEETATRTKRRRSVSTSKASSAATSAVGTQDDSEAEFGDDVAAMDEDEAAPAATTPSRATRSTRASPASGRKATPPSSRAKRQKRGSPEAAVAAAEEDDAASVEDDEALAVQARDVAVDTDGTLFKSFQRMLATKFRRERADSLPLADVVAAAREHTAIGSDISEVEVLAMILALQADNKVMYVGGVVHKI